MTKGLENNVSLFQTGPKTCWVKNQLTNFGKKSEFFEYLLSFGKTVACGAQLIVVIENRPFMSIFAQNLLLHIEYVFKYKKCLAKRIRTPNGTEKQNVS